MRVADVNRNARLGITRMVAGFTAVIVVTFNFSFNFTPVSAGTIFALPLCGEGSTPDYGFTYDLQQAHWTVDWQDYVAEQTVAEVDVILDRLNEDSIAQTMILIKSQDEVGNQVNCAVHFLRYMQLGQPTGEREDNGFVFLIVIEPTRIDVHYGVGLGLPALTASELTTLNRAAEDAYQTNHSVDEALLTLVEEFDAVARSNYLPLVSAVPTRATSNAPPLPSGPLGILNICGLLCMGTFLLLFLVWGLNQFAGRGITFGGSSPDSGSWRSGFPPGGSSGRSSPPTRGGSGSGRSRRGN